MSVYIGWFESNPQTRGMCIYFFRNTSIIKITQNYGKTTTVYLYLGVPADTGPVNKS